LDAGWKFILSDNWGTAEDLAKAGSSKGPARREFNDASWRTVDLPHDWVVELPFDQKADASHGFKPVGPGFPQNSIAWYRRTFALPKADSGKRLWLEFDGVYRDCRVFVNGYFIGHHESGYSGFRYDITDVANCGGKNSVAVRVDASQFEGWFYEGAGIYRHVWLVKKSPLAIAPDGVFVSSEFKDNRPEGAAKIHLRTELANAQGVSAKASVQWQIIGPDGKLATEAREQAEIGAWSVAKASQSARIVSPVLWSPESPKLYRLITTVSTNRHVLDKVETEFGIRTVAFDPEKGFLLNGKPCVLKGTCNHQDHAGVGSALPDRLQYFRIGRLKQMGGNAYRTSHNPPTPELLEACDHLGMLVMDENRLLGSDAANLDRLEALVRRDRNHPSVIIWSICNEEGVQESATAGQIAQTMQQAVHNLDPTREITAAANNGNVFSGINSVIQVRGWNYHIGQIMDNYHKAHPSQPNVGTEQASTVCTRGIYANDRERGYVSAYDDNAPEWAHTTETWWKFFAARPWLSGGFAWTGFDYRGEPTPYSWPCINSHFGIVDTCGFPKDNFYYYQAWWGDRAVVHLLPHWNWAGKEGQEIDVRCFSNAEEVELFLNDTSLGHKPMSKNSHLGWKVKYAPGTLLAKAYTAGRMVAQDKVETTGAPARVALTADSPAINANGEDVSVITVTVTDAQGRTVPTANQQIAFDLSGPGKIIGVGNGDPSCHEADIYLTKPAIHSIALTDWRMKKVFDTKDWPEVADKFSETGWTKVDARAEYGPLRPDEWAVFRTQFSASAGDLQATNIVLNFGMIDDEGWVYVNGKIAGESHDWSAAPSFDIRKLVREGTNSIAVAVKNNAASGGVNKGVALEFHSTPEPTKWKRSVFNGLGQLLVKSTKDAGTVTLTATAEGLAPAKLAVDTKPCVVRAAVE
jgi:beta-galactosidase